MCADYISIQRRRAHSPILAPVETVPQTCGNGKYISKTNKRYKRNNQYHYFRSDPSNKVSPIAKSQLTTNDEPQLKVFHISPYDKLTPYHQYYFIDKFRDEIRMLYEKMSLEAQAVAQFKRPDQIIQAEVIWTSNICLEESAFNFLKEQLIGYIANWQYHFRKSPLLRKMSNNSTKITIICLNSYAYSCLKYCIEDIAKTYDDFSDMSVVQSAINPKSTHCISMVFESIMVGPQLFLNQLNLHYNLKTDRWIVVDHKICDTLNKTSFLLLIDEISMLEIIHIHQYNMYICFCSVKCVDRGRFPEIE